MNEDDEWEARGNKGDDDDDQDKAAESVLSISVCKTIWAPDGNQATTTQADDDSRASKGNERNS